VKIAFFTEMGFTGKVPRTHNNMRTEFAWMCALDADHWNLNQTPNYNNYDLGIAIIPKKNPQFELNTLRKYCKKVAVMQEGPNWYWQDYPLTQQIWYYNTLRSADLMYVHNETDRVYFEGLIDKECRVMSSLMIEDSIRNLPKLPREGAVIGGNFCSWYGGFDSYIVAQELGCAISIPSMGRKVEGEEQVPLLTHLPYTPWAGWIKSLNKFKYGVHLMRTHAAGTFALNCAYLGIPCIGYKGLDTQEICHPSLTVNMSDLKKAKEIAKDLVNNEDFYLHCSKETEVNYNRYYREDKFKI
jgi:hypothetical protein